MLWEKLFVATSCAPQMLAGVRYPVRVCGRASIKDCPCWRAATKQRQPRRRYRKQSAQRPMRCAKRSSCSCGSRSACATKWLHGR